MVNHIRTLLLNKASSECDGVSNRFYIDKSFKPVDLKGEIRLARERLYLGCGTVYDDIKRTNELFSLVDRVDFRKHTGFYDTRVSVENYNKDDSGADPIDVQALLAGTRDSILFRLTDSEIINEELLNIKKLADAVPDGYAAVSARILALVLQIEAVRISQNGG